MTKIVCELCGSNDVVKQDGVYVCQHCGTKYTAEEAKKLIGTVKVDKQEEKDNLLILARRAREQGNSENAAKYYELMLQHEPNNWEAAFFSVYYQCQSTNLYGLSSAIDNLATCAASTIDLLSKTNDPNKTNNVATIIEYSSEFAFNATYFAKKHYIKFKEVADSRKEYINRATSAHAILTYIEVTLKKIMPEEKGNIKAIQLQSVKWFNTFPDVFKYEYMKNELERLNTEIKQQDPSYEAPALATTAGGCYIATAVYGSYDCPEVWTLRRYRDHVLAKSVIGRVFIHAYYAFSPTVVRLFGKAEWFKKFWKKQLDNKVADLQRKGMYSTPYIDEEW